MSFQLRRRRIKIDFDFMEIEVVLEAGVLYVHDKVNGVTLVRICGLNRDRAAANFSASADVTILPDNVMCSRSDKLP